MNNSYKIEGYYGIDIDGNLSAPVFEKLINGDEKISGEETEISRKYTNAVPKFVMIKLGETSSIDGSIAEENNVYYYRLKNISDITNLCEERKIPYGFSYNLKCTDEKEMQKEIDYIKTTLNNFSGGTYNIMPVAVSFEKASSSENGKKNQTELLNKCMNALRNDYEVITYLNNYSISDVLNYNQVENQNKQNAWIKENNNQCSTFYKSTIKDYGDFIGDASLRQIGLNQNSDSALYNVDFINKTYYDSLIEDLKLKLSQSKKSMLN